MNNSKTLMPELRFPEFRGAENWKEKSLHRISEVVMGSSPMSSAYNESGIGLPLLQGNADIKNRLSTPRIFTSQVTKRCNIGDILLSVRAPVGTVAKSNHIACIGRGLSAIRAFSDNNQEYIYQWLLYFESFWSDISQGGTFDAVNSDDIKRLLVPMPNKDEQQKIADCLSSLDELITAHTQKHQTLQLYKKGLMQNLFPAEGETVPELRFPEFRGKGEWCKTQLIDVADKNIKWSFIGGPFGSNLKSSDYVSDGVRVIQLQNIGDAEFIDDYKIFTSEEKANELLSNNIYPEDIILSKMGDPVGRACLIPDNHSRYVMCSDGIRLVVDKEKFSKYFIYILINSDWFRALTEKTATGSTRKRIGLDDLKKLPLIVPSLHEQQKIADCLSSLDDLIAAQAQKIESLKLHKKGLMQQLFPAVDEANA